MTVVESAFRQVWKPMRTRRKRKRVGSVGCREGMRDKNRASYSLQPTVLLNIMMENLGKWSKINKLQRHITM